MEDRSDPFLNLHRLRQKLIQSFELARERVPKGFGEHLSKTSKDIESFTKNLDSLAGIQLLEACPDGYTPHALPPDLETNAMGKVITGRKGAFLWCHESESSQAMKFFESISQLHSRDEAKQLRATRDALIALVKAQKPEAFARHVRSAAEKQREIVIRLKDLKRGRDLLDFLGTYLTSKVMDNLFTENRGKTPISNYLNELKEKIVEYDPSKPWAMKLPEDLQTLLSDPESYNTIGDAPVTAAAIVPMMTTIIERLVAVVTSVQVSRSYLAKQAAQTAVRDAANKVVRKFDRETS